MIIKEICWHSTTKIFTLLEAVRILQTSSQLTQNYIVYAECHFFKPLITNEFGSKVRINLLDSVLVSAEGVRRVV